MLKLVPGEAEIFGPVTGPALATPAEPRTRDGIRTAVASSFFVVFLRCADSVGQLASGIELPVRLPRMALAVD